MGRYKITFETVFRDLQLLCEKRGVVGASTSYMTLRRLFFLVLDERTENVGYLTVALIALLEQSG